jgi:hypothetical protein
MKVEGRQLENDKGTSGMRGKCLSVGNGR